MAEVSEGPGGLVLAAQRGSLSVADRVVERIAEFAALDHPSVVRHDSRLGRVTGRITSRITGHQLPRATATVAGHQARLHVEIAVAWPAPLAGTAAQVRETVADEVSRLAGISAQRVDVSIRAVVRMRTGKRVS